MNSEMEFPYRGAIYYEALKEGITNYRDCDLDYSYTHGVDIIVAL